MVLNPNPTKVLRMRARLYKGLYSRVAKRLKVSPTIVCNVANGRKRSKRIDAALVAELRRIEREIEKFADEDAA